MTDTGLQKLKPGETLDRRGGRDGMDVAVLRIKRRQQSRESGDPTIKVVH
ncbi:integrase [Bradyrhizobium betae]|uniref:Integrase n=1 Tax=Bradyrhizobium betae TaxID=244734 RepID=A0A5P6PFD5_9BRAD|nr:integrase [Bradyrhizobium betae]